MWGKKEDKMNKGLPDLPSSSAPSMRSYGKLNEAGDDFAEDEIHGLPSFPDSPMSRGFSQSAIKDAVETEDVKGIPSFDSDNRFIPPPSRKTIEIDDWMPAPPVSSGAPMLNKPIFVRLDKFTEARQSLEKVREKLGEIDDLLKTIREVKLKEEREITQWEKEIESVKARISTVNSEVFDKSFHY